LVKQHKSAFEGLGAWDVPLAAMLASVETVCKLLDLELPDDIHEALFSQPPSVLTGAKLEHEPAVTAWEILQTVLASAKTTENDNREMAFKEIRGERIAWMATNAPVWYVMTNAQAITIALEGKNWLQRYGSEWVRRGWILNGKKADGTSTASIVKYMPNNGSVRVIAIPVKGSPQGG
jgi:hypothetical protein